jgi:nucleoside-diphosphate-sugar epimerase
VSTYLVTGGAGFIGSHIAEELVKRDEKVIIFDNFSTGKKENIESFKDKVEIFNEDVRSLDLLRKATKNIDFIIHEAALNSAPESFKDPLSFEDVNVKGTLNVLLAAEDNNVKRIVFASSCAVYGDQEKIPISESVNLNPLSPYGVSKVSVEYNLQALTRNLNLPFVVLRYFNVYGPRQLLSGEYSAVIPKFISCMLSNKKPQIYGSGKQIRDFIYVKDVVEATLKSAADDRADGQTFNIGSGKSLSILDLVNKLNNVLDKNLEPEFKSPRENEIEKSVADVMKVSKLLNFSADIDIEEGLKRTIGYFKERT